MSLPTVFIAYAREDADLGAQIAAALQARGVEVHTDDGIIEPSGENIDAHLTAQIAACDAYVLLLSSATHTSARLIDATNIAYLLWLQQRIRWFLPVRISPLGPHDYARLLYRTEPDPEGVQFLQRFAILGGEDRSPDAIADRLLNALAANYNDSSIQPETEERRRVSDTLPAQEAAPPEEREGGLALGSNVPPPTRIEPATPAAPPAPAQEAPSSPQLFAPPSAPPSPLPLESADAAPLASDVVLQEPEPKMGAYRERAGETTSSPASDTALLNFSAYHPAVLPVGEWQTLLVYTHVAAALAQVQADAATFTELGSQPTTATGTATRRVRQGVELLVEPHVQGVTFSPPSDSFIWRGNWHRSLFRMQADPSLAGTTQPGWIDIYAEGLVPIARIDLRLPFRAVAARMLSDPPQGMVVTSNVHDRVFISYSHADAEAFSQARELYQQFGIAVYCDENLAAGDDYDASLAAMIDAASIFHLLWSRHSAASVECRKEWQRALHREASERFIKPWYWKKPLVPPPPEFTAHHISFRYQHLKRKWWNPATW